MTTFPEQVDRETSRGLGARPRVRSANELIIGLIEQGADFVEQDLAVTKDGVLICLHGASLERTTDVEARFPTRFTEIAIEGKTRKAWLANDFTLAEVKTLDAGSWFDAKFAGERVPTFDEAVAVIRGKAGLYPELKTPALYRARADVMAAIPADTETATVST